MNGTIRGRRIILIDLSVEICGLKLRTPVIAASGVTTRDGDSMLKSAEAGAGALVTMTISQNAARVPRPCLAKVKDGLLSCEMWSELSVEQWVKHEIPKAKRSGIPLIASVGFTADDVKKIAPRMVDAGVDALEIPLRSPSGATEIVRAAKGCGVPVFAKLMCPFSDMASAAREVESAGADGLVVSGAVGPVLSIDVESSMPVLGAPGGFGYLSGPPVKPISLRCIAEVARAVSVPVIGCGGISSGKDIVEFIMAGAAAVQVSSCVMLRGYRVYGILSDELMKFMRIKNYRNIGDIKGKALPHLPKETIKTSPTPVEVVASKCTACGLCETHCPYGAIRVSGRVARVDPVKCYGCGLCVSICPSYAIRY
ncbi:MAG: 4Fe-4S binding protein [Candidatus Hadarchaeales archaeon]